MALSSIWGPAADRLLFVALTGGIASGKSEVTAELVRLGAMVVDADKVARDVVMPGREAHRMIVERFGDRVLDAKGMIDRPALAEIVFSDSESLDFLNSVTHPAVFREMAVRANDYAESMREQDVPAVVMDAALIADIGAEGLFDRVVVVVADEESRLARLVEKRSMDPEDASRRIDSQMPDERRIKAADVVIRNDGTLRELRNRVAAVWEEIASEAKTLYS